MKPEFCPSLLDRFFPRQPRLPLALKLGYTAFMAVLVPIYWRDYGPTNFLYFCDVALFLTLAAVWLESPLLASAPLVGIFLPQMLWVVDFCFELAGAHLTEMTHYMFDAERPLFTRTLSFFHFWLPFLLLGLVWRLGYDRRAFVLWTVIAWTLMGICYGAMLPPTEEPAWKGQPVNINYVYGMSDRAPQQLMEPDWFFAMQIFVWPLAIYWPSHWLFSRLLGENRAGPTLAGASCHEPK